jgi:hypothetical protein
MLLSERWDEGLAEEPGGPSGSNEKSYFPSSAADFDDDFEVKPPPPFFARQQSKGTSHVNNKPAPSSFSAAPTSNTSAGPAAAPPRSLSSFFPAYNKEKQETKAAAASAYQDIATPAEDEEVIDLTQESFRAGDGTFKASSTSSRTTYRCVHACVGSRYSVQRLKSRTPS